MLKYRNKPKYVNNIRFASTAEADYYSDLLLLEQAGKIEILRLQPKVLLTDAEISWKIDFEVLDLDTGECVFHEVKGKETADYRLKLKLYQRYGSQRLLIIKRKTTKGKPFYIHADITIPTSQCFLN